MNSSKYVRLPVNLSCIDLVEKGHHHKCIKYDREMLGWWQCIVPITATLNIEKIFSWSCRAMQTITQCLGYCTQTTKSQFIVCQKELRIYKWLWKMVSHKNVIYDMECWNVQLRGSYNSIVFQTWNDVINRTNITIIDKLNNNENLAQWMAQSLKALSYQISCRTRL